MGRLGVPGGSVGGTEEAGGPTRAQNQPSTRSFKHRVPGTQVTAHPAAGAQFEEDSAAGAQGAAGGASRGLPRDPGGCGRPVQSGGGHLRDSQHLLRGWLLPGASRAPSTTDSSHSLPVFLLLTTMWHPYMYETGDRAFPSSTPPPVCGPQRVEQPSEWWDPTQSIRTIPPSTISRSTNATPHLPAWTPP